MERWLLLLRRGDHDPAALSDEQHRALFDRFVAWTEELHQSGRFDAVEALHEAGARVVRQADAFDGPYTEGKEAVIGLYVIRAADLGEATAIARTVPHVALGGVVEVRAIRAFPKP